MWGLLGLGWVSQQLPLAWQLTSGLTEQLQQAWDLGVLGDLQVLPVQAGPAGPSMGGGGGGGGITAPPPALPAPPLGGGMGAAISKTQYNNELNPTLVVDNWSMS